MVEIINIDQKPKDETNELLDGINYIGEKGPCFGSRHTQIVLMSIGSGIALSTRTTFSILAIAMTTADTSPNKNLPVYDWDNMGVILGAIFWSGIPVQILFGYLGKLWGPKWLILGTSLVNAGFFMLVPTVAGLWGSVGVIFCRVIQGAALGGLSPLGAVLSGLWVPAEERSKAGLIAAVGNIGIVMATSVLTGVISASSLGYPWCFYIIGIAELVWCVFWLFLGHQSPKTHPRITPEEKKYIEVSLFQKATVEIPTPWLKIISSIHFWAIIVAFMGTDWIGTMQSTTNPLYMAKALDLDLQSTATLMAIAPFVGIFSGIIIAPLSDFLIKRKYLSCINARRLFHTIGCVGFACNRLWITLLPPGAIGLVVLNLCISNIFIIMYSVGGAVVNALDISPLFAGIISGVASTFSQAFALFAPLSMDWIVHDQTSIVQWRIIFGVTAGIAVASALFFDIFATDRRQEEWEVIKDEVDEKNITKQA